MAATSENRYAPPQATVSDVDLDASGPVLASRLRRLGGSLLDGLLMGVIFWGCFFLLGFKFAPGAARAGGFTQPLNYWGLAVAVFAVLNGYLLVTRGQTLAKAMLGMRIVRPDGAKVSAGRILGLRYGVGYVIGVVPFLGGLYYLLDALLIFRESRRCLHDNIADTVVIRV